MNNYFPQTTSKTSFMVTMVTISGQDENALRLEKNRAFYHRYYWTHRDEILQKKKIYNEENKERIKAYRQLYYINNKEELNRKHKEYLNRVKAKFN